MGASKLPKACQPTDPIEVITKSSATIAMTIVPYIRALGIVLFGSFVSSARKETDSQPKKVSAIKNTAINIVDKGKTKKGWKLETFTPNSPGIIKIDIMVKVRIANVISIKALIFIPLYAMKLNIKMNKTEMSIFGRLISYGRRYWIAPTISMAIVTLPAIRVVQPIMKLMNLP